VKPRLFLMLLAMLALCIVLPRGAVAAEEAPAQIAMEELATRLNLTAEQQAQIAPALEQRNTRLKAMAGEINADSSRREKLKALRQARSIQKEFVGKVSPVLTKEQAAEWEKFRDEARDRLKERRSSQD
jgi:hypothetical protein